MREIKKSFHVRITDKQAEAVRKLPYTRGQTLVFGAQFIEALSLDEIRLIQCEAYRHGVSVSEHIKHLILEPV